MGLCVCVCMCEGGRRSVRIGTTRSNLADLTFVKKTKCWYVWSITLLEEEEFTFYCQYLNVLMTTNTSTYITRGRERVICVRHHFSSWTASFLGIISSMCSAKGGYWSNSFALTPRTTLDLAWLKPEMSVDGSNLNNTVDEYKVNHKQALNFLNIFSS